jgi:hypothetical protein
MAKAELTTVKNFFQEGGPKLAANEIMACKKNKETGEVLEDYDEIAEGIGNGSFTYPDVSPERKAAAAARVDSRPVPVLRG